MAPVEDRADFFSCPSGYYYSDGYCYENSNNWYSWGRWVLVAGVVLVILLIFVTMGCINSRRRRRNGLPPRYGTGWMSAPPKYSQNDPSYYGGAPPPQYQPPQHPNPQLTSLTFNQNEGYYGSPPRENVLLQEPSQSYQRGTGGDPVYDPPVGPPPSKIP